MHNIKIHHASTADSANSVRNIVIEDKITESSPTGSNAAIDDAPADQLTATMATTPSPAAAHTVRVSTVQKKPAVPDTPATTPVNY